mmetsp:Transcript_20075/g.40313  ORF Transcript_20075/g.40313 Transcript_20075/m.40313 type:complete len:200 (+) Transcript_20075:2361-2960(+)
MTFRRTRSTLALSLASKATVSLFALKTVMLVDLRMFLNAATPMSKTFSICTILEILSKSWLSSLTKKKNVWVSVSRPATLSMMMIQMTLLYLMRRPRLKRIVMRRRRKSRTHWMREVMEKVTRILTTKTSLLKWLRKWNKREMFILTMIVKVQTIPLLIVMTTLSLTKYLLNKGLKNLSLRQWTQMLVSIGDQPLSQQK